MTELVTARLLLRRPTMGDLDAMFEIMSDPRAMQFWSTLPHASREVTEPWLKRLIARNAEGGEDFLIVLDGRVVGNVGAGQLPEFGFILHGDCWGKGIATEACAAFIDYVFRTYDIPALTADVDPRNAGSLKVLSKLGFVETGRGEKTYMLVGGWSDSIYLALPRPR